MPKPCPPLALLQRMIDDDLQGPEAEVVESHVASCEPCQDVLERLTRPATEAGETIWTGPESGLTPTDRPGSTRAGFTPGPTRGPGLLPDVPGYAIDRELGRGGMGIVYLARQLRAERLVALKMVLAPGRLRAEDALRFRIEGQALARFRHPNIVQVHDVGEYEGGPFLALEFVEGGSLAGALRGDTPTPRQAAAFVETLAHAVHSAHQAGILHRDLKPANILLARAPGAKSDGASPWDEMPPITPKVTDFGLAKQIDTDSGVTRSGQILGTPSYMAPEQAGNGAGVGVPADVYALGAILYEMLAGRPPFRGDSPWDTLLQVVHEPPVPPSKRRDGIPRDLETICLKCLAKDPAARYASADAMAEDLRRFLESRPIQARSAGPAERLWLWCRRRPALAGLAAALVLAVVAGAAGVATQWLRAEANAARSRDRLDLAMGAIERYYSGVSKDALLRQPDFRDLRASLLRPPMEFYRRLRDDLERDARPDPDARRRLAEATAALAGLIADVEPPEAAITAHIQALAAADALAADRPGDREARRLAARLRVRLGALAAGANRPDEAEKAIAAALASLGPANEDPLDQDVRAAALSALGEAEFTRRHLEKAGAHLAAATEIRRRLVAGRPDDAEALEALADAERRLAIFHAEMRRNDLVEPLFRSVLATSERLASVRRDDASRFRLAKAHNNYGALCINSDRTPEAEAHFIKAIALLEPLVESSPSIAMYRSDLAVGHFNMGTFLDNSGRRELAAAAYSRALEIQRRLARDYADAEVHQERFCRTAAELVLVALHEKKYDRATAASREVVAMRERMARRNPQQLAALAQARRIEGQCEQKTGRTFAASLSYRGALADFDRVIADGSALPDEQWMRADCLMDPVHLAIATRAPHRVGPLLDRALASYDRIVRDLPAQPKYVTSRANCWAVKGDWLAYLGRGPEAIEWYDRAAEAARAILAKEPDDMPAWKIVSYCHAGRADVLSDLRRWPDALAEWAAAAKARPEPDRVELFALRRAATLARSGAYRDAIKAVEDLGEPAKLEENVAQVAAARVYALASEAARSDPSLPPDTRSASADGFADRAMTALARARHARWTGDGAVLARSLTGHEFDALRDRPDFRDLVADLAFPADPFAP